MKSFMLTYFHSNNFPYLLTALVLMSVTALHAQQSQMIQVKTFNEQLQPIRDVGVSINKKEFITTNDKGVAFTEIAENELPVKSIDIKDKQLEAKAWNYGKNILEVTIRRKSYQLTNILVRDQHQNPIPNLSVVFTGKKTTEVITNATGRAEIPLGIEEHINSATQFTVENREILGLQSIDGSYVLTIKALEQQILEDTVVIANVPKVEVSKPITNKEYLGQFDFSKIDSIQSLTMFYAIFKNYEIQSLDEKTKQKIDKKFNALIGQLQRDTVSEVQLSYLGQISDSSIVENDIRNLLNHATAENLTLLFQKDQFDEKIEIIDSKLKGGMESLDENARAALYSDLLELERLLRENEILFYKNLNYYRDIINSLKEKYFDFQHIENKLSESEARLLEEQRIFRQRILGISAVVLVFTILILLLIRFSTRLKKQKVALLHANDEVKRINGNLEGIVLDRTKMLEESNRELDTFLYRASHDLRSPVCSIKGLCNILVGFSDGEPKELVERVVTTTDKMDRLLLKLGIMSEINHPSEYIPINFLKMAMQVKQKFEEIISEQNIDFEIDCSEEIAFISYPRLVEVVLTSLVENAVYYGVLHNSKPTKITLKGTVVKDTLKFSVEDNGVGIDENLQPKLFNMFFKGHEASKGNGLGLYIVQKSIGRLKGSITVESEPGEFSKFTVQIPLKIKPVVSEKVPV